jgi:fucose permease
MIYLITFLPINFVSSHFIEKYGTKIGLFLGIGLTIIGLWGKILINSGFNYVLTGKCLAGIGQPFIMNIPAKISYLDQA